MYAGKIITNSADKLLKISVEYLYQCMRNPKPEIEAKIRNLRIVRDIDKKAYAKCKRELPYFVCGTFSPPYRRTENFAYTEFFVIDIDHIGEKGLDIKTVREKIEKDERVLLSFVSPGEDGLKVIFRFKEKCTEPTVYKLFYQMFAKQFSEQFQLQQVVDTQTNDVCRACFISIDYNAYYNPDSLAVDISDFVNQEDSLAFFDIKREVENLQKNTIQQQKNQDKDFQETTDKDPDIQSIERIKEILKLSKPKIEKSPVIISEHLTEIMDDLRAYIQKSGIEVVEVININYGKKIRLKLGLRKAEVNVFYGKRGYSVVVSPRVGTDAELNNLSAELIEGFFVL